MICMACKAALLLGALTMARQTRLEHFWQQPSGGPKSPPPAFAGGTEGSLESSVPGGGERHPRLTGTHESTEPRPGYQATSTARVAPESRGGPAHDRHRGTFKVWSFNVNSLQRGRLHEILDIAGRHRVSAAALQGTRWKSNGSFTWQQWHVVVSAAEQVVDGVLIAVHRPTTPVRATVRLPGRLLEARWQQGSIPVVLLTGYAPTETRSEHERRTFWHTLDRTIAPVAMRHQLVLAGDFNAHIGRGRSNPWVGSDGATQWNSNGEALHDIASRRQLRVLNTFGAPKATAWTWQKPGSKCGTRIDYVAVRGERAKHAQQVGPITIPALTASMGYTDRRPVSAQWHMPCLHRLGPRRCAQPMCDRLLTREAYREHEAQQELRARGHSLALTQRAADAERYSDRVAQALQAGQDADSAMFDAAQAIFPPTAQPRRRWISLDTWHLVKERQAMWKQCVQTGALGRLTEIGVRSALQAWIAWHKWHRTHRMTKRALDKDKRAHLEDSAAVAQRAALRGDQRTVYEMVRQMAPRPLRNLPGLRRGDGALVANAQEELDEWDKVMRQTYEAHGNMPTECKLPPTEGTLVTQADTLSALRKRKLGKSTPKGVPCNEMVRLAEHALSPHLTQEWNRIATEGAMPASWRTTELVWIPKPGQPSNDPRHMRGAHLLHPLAAGCCTALQRRSRGSWAHLWSPCEHGGLPKRSTRDPLIVINTLIQRARKLQRSFSCYFGDLRKAFDLISRDKVVDSLRALLPPGPLQRAAVDRHVDLRTVIRCQDEAHQYSLPHGVAQGDSLGPICFIGTYHRFCEALEASRPDDVREATTGTFTWNGHSFQVPMNKTLFVNDRAEFWLTPTESTVTSPLTNVVQVQQGWGVHLNWDKVQMLIQPLGKGRKRRFPNSGTLH